MARDIQLAVAAAQLAVADAGLVDGGVDPTRIGIDLGAGLISSELDELAPAIGQRLAAGQRRSTSRSGAASRSAMIEPIWLLKYLPNMLACHISILIDCQGPSNTITEADAVVEPGDRRGGPDHRPGPGRRDDHRRGRLEDPSAEPGPDEPARDRCRAGRASRAQACRPFDRRRDGWVPGEGAGIVILEEREHALQRGARIYGEVLGFGSGCDAMPGGGLDPEGVGTEVAITAALRRGRARAVRRSATSTPTASATRVSDLAEARAFNRIFGAGRRAGHGPEGLHGQPGLRLRRRRADRQPDRRQSRADPADPQLRRARPGDASSTWSSKSPRPTDNPTFVNTNLTPHGQAAALVDPGLPRMRPLTRSSA